LTCSGLGLGLGLGLGSALPSTCFCIEVRSSEVVHRLKHLATHALSGAGHACAGGTV